MEAMTLNGLKTRIKRVLRPETLSLILPILVEQSLLMAMGIVNSVMASHLGTNAVSAIGMVDSVNNLVVAFFSSLAIGATVVIAHYTGRGDIKNANETLKQSLYSSLALIVPVVLLMLIFRKPLVYRIYSAAEPAVLANTTVYLFWSALSYPFIAFSGIANGAIRGAGDTRTPMFVTLLMNIINIVLGYVLIYGLRVVGIPFDGLGITGAALAIFAARVTGALVLEYILVFRNLRIRLIQPFRFKFNKSLQASLFGIGMPASVENLLFNLGKVITQTFIVMCGTAAIAANYYSGPCFTIMNLPGNAMNVAAATLVGQFMGRGQTEEAQSIILDMLAFTMGIQAVISLVFLPLARPFLGIYHPEPAVLALTLQYVYMSCLTFPLLWPASFIIPSGLRSTGDSKFCMIVSVSSMWAVRIGVGYLLSVVLKMGVTGVWIGMFADWLVRGSIYLARLLGGKWRKHQVIREL